MTRVQVARSRRTVVTTVAAALVLWFILEVVTLTQHKVWAEAKIAAVEKEQAGLRELINDGFAEVKDGIRDLSLRVDKIKDK